MFLPTAHTTIMAFFGGFGGFPVVYGGAPQVVFDGVPPHVIVQMGGVMAQAPDVFVARPYVMVDDSDDVRDSFYMKLGEIDSLKKRLLALVKVHGVHLHIDEPDVVTRRTHRGVTRHSLGQMDTYIVVLKGHIRRFGG